MADPTNRRKIEHLQALLQNKHVERNGHHFDEVQLMHRALPEIDLDEVDPSVNVMGKQLDFPLLISSMTGGSDAQVLKVNQRLARAAEATKVAMAVGSQRVMFTHPSARDSFRLREWAPNTLLLANLGAVQLNNGFGLEQAQMAIEVLQADGLCLHLNPLQEAVQPEGNTNFAGLASAIGNLNRQINVPLTLKEVGTGLAPDDIELGLAHGIRWFDVAGRGGTSWARIEQQRRDDRDQLGITLQDWGITTPQALRLARPYMKQANFIASGGLRNGLDMVKSVIMGGSLCGIAAPLLVPAMQSTAAVIRVIEALKKEFVTVMFLLSARRLDQLMLNDALLLS